MSPFRTSIQCFITHREYTIQHTRDLARAPGTCSLSWWSVNLVTILACIESELLTPPDWATHFVKILWIFLRIMDVLWMRTCCDDRHIVALIFLWACHQINIAHILYCVIVFRDRSLWYIVYHVIAYDSLFDQYHTVAAKKHIEMVVYQLVF